LISLETGKTSVVETRSVNDAEALAAVYATSGITRLDATVWQDPALPYTQARLFSVGRMRTAVADRDGVKIVGPHGSVEARLANYGVLGISKSTSGYRIYVQMTDRVSWLDEANRFALGKQVVRPPAEAQFAGGTPRGDLIYFGDTDDGTFIWSISEDGTKTVLAAANGYVKAILSPTYRSVKYLVAGKLREGLLIFPTVSRFGKRPPVILTGYPQPFPIMTASNWLTKIASPIAWRYQPLLAAGFAIFCSDYRAPASALPGSREYIETPDAVLSEMVPSIEAIRNEHDVDASKLGFTGFSHGGYTALTLLNRSAAFKAIAAEVPLANLSLDLGTPAEIRLLDCAAQWALLGLQEIETTKDGFIRLGGPPYRNRERMIRDSPLFNMESAITPTLLIAGEFDLFAPNAEETYLMLLRKGVPTQLVTYWGESHVISSPGNVRDLVNRQIAWFTKYLSK
jgi:dipeptidyl aminopeptidase/acylaminoacyl peptidase